MATLRFAALFVFLIAAPVCGARPAALAKMQAEVLDTDGDGIGVNASGRAFDPPPVERTDEEIVEVGGIETVRQSGGLLQSRYFENPKYKCGRSGDFSFVIMNRKGLQPSALAPLWVYLHGGGLGYYDSDGTYKPPNAESQNDAEDRDKLSEHHILKMGILREGCRQTATDTCEQDVIFNRRLREGYRLLVVSMCDHDMYLGRGTTYPNNPREDTLNGLQANMAAVEYTVKNFATSHIFVHGTSAGSPGSWGLSYSFAAEGKPLSGAITDSYLLSERTIEIIEHFKGQQGFPYPADFDAEQAMNKLGDFALGYFPEDVIGGGYTGTPTMDIYGVKDRHCAGPAGYEQLHGMNNCDYLHERLKNAIESQMPSTLHRQLRVPEGGHVVTRRTPGWWTDEVDEWVSGLLTRPVPCIVPESCTSERAA